MSNKSNELEIEIVQLKATKSQTLESINNVLVGNMDEMKKLNNSYTHFKTELNGMFKPGSKPDSRIQDFTKSTYSSTWTEYRNIQDELLLPLKLSESPSLCNHFRRTRSFQPIYFHFQSV